MSLRDGLTRLAAPVVCPAAVLLALTQLPASAFQAPQAADEQVQNGEESGQNCSFRSDPQEAELSQNRARNEAYERVLRFAQASGAASRSVAPGSIPRRNLVDDHIFTRLISERMDAASVAPDETFLRRVSLDLAGKIPTADEVRAFVASTDPDKRNVAIDQLLKSPEFVDKWTMWLGDLLGNARVNANRNLHTKGRNALHWWMKSALEQGASFRDVAYIAVATVGRNYDLDAAGTNFMVRSFHPMGPAQDTYDMMLTRTATAFLGMSHYDCILCHDGRRHLDSISLWGSTAKRADAQKMAAHFARTTMTSYQTTDTTHYYYNSFQVADRASGSYGLSTSYGNRPVRTPPVADGQTISNYTPVYRNGKLPQASKTWRESLHAAMVEDELFAINYANRLWKAMFGLGLVEPVDSLDPARLDPSNPPAAPWTLQASHPELLIELAKLARAQDFNIREFVRVLAESSAYQLDSAYDGPWDITKMNLFARRIPRRIEGEEFHDALMKATGTALPGGGYTVEGWGDVRVVRAMQLPEPVEPRSNGSVSAFLNSFNRGNRDNVPRSQAGSILLQLNVMNNALVTERIRTKGSSPSPFVTAMAAATDDSKVVEEMFLTFLGRWPGARERETALKLLSGKSGVARSAAVEDLAWGLVNKTDFLFSY
ncbi:MAG TPA: DUF1549 domain-containing protein [Bryobacteraceae bacterium]|nr:DUF1549 domain-containing protein [Bryobacteraceae bacterium]